MRANGDSGFDHPSPSIPLPIEWGWPALTRPDILEALAAGVRGLKIDACIVCRPLISGRCQETSFQEFLEALAVELFPVAGQFQREQGRPADAQQQAHFAGLKHLGLTEDAGDHGVGLRLGNVVELVPPGVGEGGDLAVPKAQVANSLRLDRHIEDPPQPSLFHVAFDDIGGFAAGGDDGVDFEQGDALAQAQAQGFKYWFHGGNFGIAARLRCS